MRNKRKIVTLTLTQKCNLSCIYCYENHKSSKKMNFETAKAIVDKEMQFDDGFDEVEFDLFGGEPFLNFELIKLITNYIMYYDTEKKVIIFIVTNGTVLNDDIKQWLVEHRKYVVCGLSLDGTKEMTDLNRCNSFDKIDLDFFLKYYNDQFVKMTVSPLTLNSLADGVIYLENLGFKVSCNLAYNIDWSNNENVSILERELMKLINHYISNPQIEPVNLINMSIDNVAVEKDNLLIPFCGAGRTMKSYDVNGECYPCQFFMPLSVGEEKAKLAQKMKFYQDFIPEELWDDKCKDCVIKNICPTCLGSNYAASGNMYYHEENYCKLTKVTIKARSYFKAQQILNNQLSNLSEQEIQKLKKAIYIIQKNLLIN